MTEVPHRILTKRTEVVNLFAESYSDIFKKAPKGEWINLFDELPTKSGVWCRWVDDRMQTKCRNDLGLMSMVSLYNVYEGLEWLKEDDGLV